MKRKIWLFILFLCWLFGFWVFASGGMINPNNLPKFEHRVNDYSHVLTDSEHEELNLMAQDLESNSGLQVATVLLPHSEGNQLFDIALKAFNENKIWSQEKNDGLLLAIATEEKKIRIIVGYGLEAAIPDILASQIIEEHIRPAVNKGNYAQAIRNFYTFLSQHGFSWNYHDLDWSNKTFWETYASIFRLFGGIALWLFGLTYINHAKGKSRWAAFCDAAQLSIGIFIDLLLKTQIWRLNSRNSWSWIGRKTFSWWGGRSWGAWAWN